MSATDLHDYPFLDLRAGDSPLVLSIPHGGTDIPSDIADTFNETGLAVPDTDWWMARLYGLADDLKPTVLQTSVSRYVIDVNRDPSGVSLYPGQATTELCPTTTFDGDPIYRPGAEPDAAEIARRRTRYFDPYHALLAETLAAVRERHGYVLLYDCHSIRSVVPRLFDGVLPVFNIGTNSGASCAPEIEAAVISACTAGGRANDGRAAAPSLDELTSHTANGRFKGGYITRHHGQPDQHIHAVQMELALRAYMLETPPWTYDAAKATDTASTLHAALGAMLAAGARLYGGSI